MLRQSEFLGQLRRLLGSRVDGLSDAEKLGAARALIDEFGRGAQAPGVELVPFVTGRRPIDEAAYPGLGSSDNAGLILGDRAADNRVVVLYRLPRASTEGVDGLGVDVSLTFQSADGRAIPVPGWHRRPIEPRAYADGDPPHLEDVPPAAIGARTLAFDFAPEQALLPGAGWGWAELDPGFRAEATDAEDPFTFGHLFHQRLGVELRLTREGAPIAVDVTELDICDARRFGTLYERVLDQLVRPDAEAQAATAEAPEVGAAYHPWFPVLVIGSDKAALYTRALVEDIVGKERHLTDPAWLMRVGLYLELLTCIGIFEAVVGEVGDLLTPAERAAYDRHPAYREIRERIDVAAWREVWALRKIAFPRWSSLKTGPVDALNLIAKKRATLAFLEAHHADLQHAIELAGANSHNAQETWHRVFRDAERAVLRKTPDAFPELAAVREATREFVLWHRRGHLDLPALRHVPGAITTLFGDQDGLYAAACNQYRASMNEVAEEARAHGLMAWSGGVCVPPGVSLFEAHMSGDVARFARLQRRDGYAPTLEVRAVPEAFAAARGDVKQLLDGVSVFEPLSDDERQDLARRARPIRLGPVERILIQGATGSSLFVVAEGEVEVLWRGPAGEEVGVGRLGRGGVIGEMTLLTDAPRRATVRSVDEATLYEVGREHLAPILARRPALVEALVELMTRREQSTREAVEGRSASGARWRAAIRALFFGRSS